jgi:isocitrate dehydrogenase kinase/phosphatase
MSEPGAFEALAASGAERIHLAFLAFQRSFEGVTALARGRFERREWHRAQDDSQKRLDLYSESLADLVHDLRGLLDDGIDDERLWKAMRQSYLRTIEGEPNEELARTYFNSVTRRIFTTVGVNPEIEFVGIDSALRDLRTGSDIYRRYVPRSDLRDLVRELMRDYRFGVDWRDAEADADEVTGRVEEHLQRTFGSDRLDALETLEAVFFRNKGAYVVGRIRRDIHVVPFVLALLNPDDGVTVDAVLLQQDEVSVVFSFTRSYFLVETRSPRELIVFLKSIMPLKPIAELYTALGYNKHGKTELYRSLLRHMRKYDDRFEVAPGDAGMVMLVFTLRGFDMVFKVIRDRFAPPKDTSHASVMERYRLVFKHDRVGRLIDAHEFEHLTFARDRFSGELLDELLSEAAQTVEANRDEVVVHHLYVERKVTPLNLYLRQSDPASAVRAVIDYGNAIKELAAANIFPGDFLLKNFGVTRHGRVVFYDYDELCLLEQCRFRRLPPARVPEDELAAEPWFGVGEDDVFPEEFRRFLGMDGVLRATFEQHHSDLFTVEFWKALQRRHRAGDLVDVFPYPPADRLEPSTDPTDAAREAGR